MTLADVPNQSAGAHLNLTGYWKHTGALKEAPPRGCVCVWVGEWSRLWVQILRLD